MPKKHKVLEQFDEAVSITKIVTHKVGDMIDVAEGDVDDWAKMGWIDSDAKTVKEATAPEAKKDAAKDGGKDKKKS